MRMAASDDRLDREMLRSMAASLSLGVDFSFNRQDMVALLLRAADRVDPRPRAVKAQQPPAKTGEDA